MSAADMRAFADEKLAELRKVHPGVNFEINFMETTNAKGEKMHGFAFTVKGANGSDPNQPENIVELRTSDSEPGEATRLFKEFREQQQKNQPIKNQPIKNQPIKNQPIKNTTPAVSSTKDGRIKEVKGTEVDVEDCQECRMMRLRASFEEMEASIARAGAARKYTIY